ncbi:DUF4358 domain-containing protein [Floccifex sp.]|uniref:DUF4358 domain-containing protein n=1 Tax=Floccifex sp. TaxID=2815810 RepID=UPI003F00224D
MKKYQIGQIICVICIAFFMFTQIRIPKESGANFEVVSQTTIAKVDTSTLQQQDNLEIKRFLSLNPEEYESIVYYKDTDAMKASEFVIVKFKNSDQANQFRNSIDQRIENQQKVFDGYIEDQASLLKQSIVDIQGNYALYAVLPNAKEVDETFLSVI